MGFGLEGPGDRGEELVEGGVAPGVGLLYSLDLVRVGVRLGGEGEGEGEG